MSNKTINSWDWDVRVRERNLRKGILTDKDVEKHLGGLPDVAEQAEPVGQSQPALAARDESAPLPGTPPQTATNT